MSGFVDSILNVTPVLAYLIVACLVFAEDALFVGFVLPGETAAVLGGVVASRGHVQLWLMMVLVVLAAILGDSVGYEIGKHFGPRILQMRILRKKHEKLDQAQDFLRRRGERGCFPRTLHRVLPRRHASPSRDLAHAVSPVLGLQRRGRPGLGRRVCSPGVFSRQFL
ncbi:DedA family protein [Cryobacterium sp. 10C3]|uniref:DedA family protein n=1 Tax=Cryobacterium sp. 10C3 TaxID=3048577 RepID=UPI003A1019DD